MAEIKEIKGNIFDSKCEVIVNTVNCKGFMGKGIALEFRYRYPEMFENYVLQCTNNQIKIGELTLWEKSTPKIINFPTKNDWKQPSKMEYIEKGLKSFVQNYSKWEIKSIAFPILGALSGGLNPDDVKELMYRYLKPLKNIDIEIYFYNPNAKDMLFEKFYNLVKKYSLNDYEIILQINKKQAQLLHNFINKEKAHTMRDIQEIDGLGEKTIEKIYSFLNKKEGKNLFDY